MSQLSDIWGATDEDPAKPEISYTVADNLFVVHQRIVAIQDIIEDQIHGTVLRNHFDCTIGLLNAILGLDESWLEDRSANREKLAMCAEKCRNTQLYAHTRELLDLEKKFNEPK